MTSAPRGVTTIRPIMHRTVMIHYVMEIDVNRARMTNASVKAKTMFVAVDVS